MGHLFSRPCLCFGLVLEMQFSTPPRETMVADVIVIVVVVVFYAVKLRRGRLNYVGADRAGKFCVADAIVALPQNKEPRTSTSQHQTASDRWLCVAGLMIAMAD